MTLDNQTLINEYFNTNYNSLRRYAAAIIRDRNRTYCPEEIVNESFLYLCRCERLIPEKIDQFAKAWISLTITKERSFANLKLALRNDSGTEKVTGLEDEQVEPMDEVEFALVLELMPTRRREAINLLLECVTIDECCKRTGTEKRKMKKELSLARSCFQLTRKQLNK